MSVISLTFLIDSRINYLWLPISKQSLDFKISLFIAFYVFNFCEFS